MNPGGLVKRILVADDEDQIRESVRAALEALGYDIIEADNGTRALDLARSQKPHLIISDVVMDSGSGFLLRELLREDEETSLIPLILMTGHAQGAGAWDPILISNILKNHSNLLSLSPPWSGRSRGRLGNNRSFLVKSCQAVLCLRLFPVAG